MGLVACEVPPVEAAAAVREVDDPLILVDIHAVGEGEGLPLCFCRHLLRHSSAGADHQQPEVGISNVEITSGPVELQPERPSADFLHHSLVGAAAHILVPPWRNGEVRPPLCCTVPPQDAAVGDAGVRAAAATVEGDALRPRGGVQLQLGAFPEIHHGPYLQRGGGNDDRDDEEGMSREGKPCKPAQAKLCSHGA